MLRSTEDLAVVVWSQVRRKSVDTTQVKLSPSDHVEQHGKTAGTASGADALGSCGLGHVKTVDAESK